MLAGQPQGISGEDDGVLAFAASEVGGRGEDAPCVRCYANALS